MKFNELGLEPGLISAVADHGYTLPTPIQVEAIPPVLAGRDLLAGAQTGTGKTAAFVLPLLQLLGAATGRAPRALILAPTRELAAQILESIRVYGARTKLRARAVFGGVGEQPQIDALRGGCDLLVATPGRLLDLAERRLADLSGVRHLVLDEADRMLDMGFIHDIRRILKLLPAKRQNLLFSATYTPDIRALAARILVNPAQVEVTPPNSTVERVVQLAFRVAKDDKRHLLVHLFEHGANGEGRWSQALVFTRTKHGANRLSGQLERAGIRSAAIHGNKSQSARTRALADFKAGKLTALVATEVASRGLDIRELPQVVNYDMPHVPEDYVHRIGRTARAGNDGHAVSLVCQEEAQLLRDIERTMRQSIPFAPTPAFARATPVSPAPQEQRATAAGNRAPGGSSHRRPSRAAPRSYGGRRRGGR
ncbi:MAG: DEAD/DEAH box helicase [Gammaproteobacteria bacterium]